MKHLPIAMLGAIGFLLSLAGMVVVVRFLATALEKTSPLVAVALGILPLIGLFVVALSSAHRH